MNVAKVIDQSTGNVVATQTFTDFYDAVVWASAQVSLTPGTRYEVKPA